MDTYFYKKVIYSEEIDVAYLRFQAEDMFKDKSLYEKIKTYFILHAIAAQGEDFPPIGKREISKLLPTMGEELKGEILPKFTKWYNSHTSAENFLSSEDWNEDPEASMLFPFVEDGYYSWNDVNRVPHKVDIINVAMKIWRKEALQYQVYSSDDRKQVRDIYDSIVNGGENWSEFLSQEERLRLVEKCKPYIFKEWKKIFGADLKKPQQQVGLAIQRLRSADVNSLPTAITISLNVAHVFGKMFEHLDLSKDEMDQLSNVKQTEIDIVKNRLLDIS